MAFLTQCPLHRGLPQKARVTEISGIRAVRAVRAFGPNVTSDVTYVTLL